MEEGQVMTNTEFDFPFAGKTYKVKKVNIATVMIFQRKVSEIQAEKDPAGDLRMGVYALYLVLNIADPTITEDYVTQNCPGDIDIIDIFKKFGFMNQRKTAVLNKISNLLVSQPNGEKSSAL